MSSFLYLRTGIALVLNMVCRYGKVAMHYAMRSLTALPRDRISVPTSKTVQDTEKRSVTKL